MFLHTPIQIQPCLAPTLISKGQASVPTLDCPTLSDCCSCQMPYCQVPGQPKTKQEICYSYVLQALVGVLVLEMHLIRAVHPNDFCFRAFMLLCPHDGNDIQRLSTLPDNRTGRLSCLNLSHWPDSKHYSRRLEIMLGCLDQTKQHQVCVRVC